MKTFFRLLFLTGFLVALPAQAADFSQMNPTVKIVSYKKLFTNQITAYGSGSGTVISGNGLILTNNHVIFDDDEFKPLDTFEICITFDFSKEPECRYTARLIANDKDMDLALLQMNPRDVFGAEVPALNTLSIQNPVVPQEKTRVQVLGYPGSGGETLTITQGQISGFEIFDNAKYFKTDSDIDFGNSGGTVLDENGNFIGIPTYIRSYAETLGYFLDLREALPWIAETRNDLPQWNASGEAELTRRLKRLVQTNESLKYMADSYPFFELTLPKGWKFLDIANDSIYAEQKQLNNRVGISLYWQQYQFGVDDGYLRELDEQLSHIKDRYPDFIKEVTTFAGETAWKITYTSYRNKNVTYYIPYGYTLLGLSYSVNLDQEAKQIEALTPVLESFKFAQSAKSDPALEPVITFDEPPFSIRMAGDFRIQKNPSDSPYSLLAEAAQKNNYKGVFQIHYHRISKNEQALSPKQRLNETVKSISQSTTKLLSKNDAVIIDGLTGYLYTVEYEGSKYQEIHKRMTLVLQNGDYEFSIQYDDLAANFDANLATIQQILNSFEFRGDVANKRETDFGSLGEQFTDIQHHRFANEIASLAEKGVVSGYGDGTFRPEASVSRAEALKIILESKNYMESQKGLGDDIDFATFENTTSSFGDVRTGDWYKKYVQYAREKEVIQGISASRFAPHNTVTLAEGLKMIFNVYIIPTWAGETQPWTKKYMDKAYELGLLPRGWDEANKPLTRAELSYLVDTVYHQAKP